MTDRNDPTARAREAVRSFVEGGTHSRPPEAPIGPGLRLLAELTDTTPETLRDEPRRALGALGEVARELARLAKDATTGDEEIRTAARARYDRITETLREHGFVVPQPEAPAPGAGTPPETRTTAANPAEKPAPADADTNRGTADPTPGDLFRARLHDILSGAVDRLEALRAQVLPEDERTPRDRDR